MFTSGMPHGIGDKYAGRAVRASQERDVGELSAGGAPVPRRKRGKLRVPYGKIKGLRRGRKRKKR